MKTLITIISLALTLTACGGMEIDKDSFAQEPAEIKAVDSDESEIADEAQAPTNNDTTSVDVSVEVDVSVSTGKSESKEPEFAVSADYLTWHEAQYNAPEGMRVATRSEILDAHDLGMLDSLLGPRERVWSASDYDSEHGWTFDRSSEIMLLSDKDRTFVAVWISE